MLLPPLLRCYFLVCLFYKTLINKFIFGTFWQKMPRVYQKGNNTFIEFLNAAVGRNSYVNNFTLFRKLFLSFSCFMWYEYLQNLKKNVVKKIRQIADAILDQNTARTTMVWSRLSIRIQKLSYLTSFIWRNFYNLLSSG